MKKIALATLLVLVLYTSAMAFDKEWAITRNRNHICYQKLDEGQLAIWEGIGKEYAEKMMLFLEQNKNSPIIDSMYFYRNCYFYDMKMIAIYFLFNNGVKSPDTTEKFSTQMTQELLFHTAYYVSKRYPNRPLKPKDFNEEIAEFISINQFSGCLGIWMDKDSVINSTQRLVNERNPK